MSDTLLSHRIEAALCDLDWSTPAGVADQWEVLFRLLPALRAQSSALGSVTGTLRLGRGSFDAPTFEEFSVRADDDISVLRARIESGRPSSWPIELSLKCEPLLWLADDHVKVIDYDDTLSEGPDLWSPGHATIAEVTNQGSIEPGLRLWRLLGAPVPLLSLEVLFVETGMGLSLISNCDLWRPTRLDGMPTPYGKINSNLLAVSMAEVAAETNATICFGQ